ncbi:MAG: antibiotic biosynthesis monooxygenase [Synechococcales bacterium]|nr:antibiotic biosynthesis monooxygenase [Synechococcales bacterium]
MSDFQDFLTRQFAHVALGEFKPGRFEEARALYEAAVSTYATGFEGAYLLRDPDTDRGLSIILWDSLEDMEASQTEAHQEILKKMTPLFTQIPDTGFYEVVCHLDP